MTMYKFPKARNWESVLANVEGYIVASDIPGLYYISDQKQMAMIRHDEMAVWDVNDTPSEAKRLSELIRQEVLDIYEDIKSLRGRIITQMIVRDKYYDTEER